MNPLKSRNFNPGSLEGEYNLVETFCNFRAVRLKAGVLAGIFAGVMMIIFGMIYCATQGIDITAPMKIAGLPILGNEALQYGSAKAIIVGLAAFFAYSIFHGMTYAHVTGKNHKGALFGMGLTWAAWSWVFVTCLFMPAFQHYYEAEIPRGVMFFAWIVWGQSLRSVAWFDKSQESNTPQKR
ncbi:MAG: hypothetical protein JST80_08130 [Bdellovibrionales bacterium]|nr:hypothetical protein [Bdellovibrionales bacterium]